jgi:hypothetical protein
MPGPIDRARSLKRFQRWRYLRFLGLVLIKISFWAVKTVPVHKSLQGSRAHRVKDFYVTPESPYSAGYCTMDSWHKTEREKVTELGQEAQMLSSIFL